ncbi:phenazine biosynthesis FMN-dependent oxidase PhzG [Nocardia altamirensis]|uniref:phenazine biosynthesis FMN-dependent oxidase PhzG n=1 Tax=Nocardia altamirensis TaxID=472158 RepID=UPI0008408CF2|nr:phenazine biosynthesis FMN-dependent oxidase PhzG [Nocardia altamirensis]
MRPADHETLTAAVEHAFPEYFDPPADPAPILHAWLAAARKYGVREPLALALATADAAGRPSTRMVSIIGVEPNVLVFASHTTSRKGRDLAVNRQASGVLYWRETGQQIVLSGTVAPMRPDESDVLWRARPRALHPMSVASEQSHELPEPAQLARRAAALADHGALLPRPARFVGYRCAMDEIEFWCSDPDRLHRRLVYRRAHGQWQWTRLQP